MNVAELIEQLQKLPQDKLVLLSKDDEGNDFRELSDIDFDNVVYKDHEVGLETLTEEAKEIGYTEDDILEDGVQCIVLY